MPILVRKGSGDGSVRILSPVGVHEPETVDTVSKQMLDLRDKLEWVRRGEPIMIWDQCVTMRCVLR